MSEPLTPKAAMAALMRVVRIHCAIDSHDLADVRAAAEALVVAELRALESESPCDGHEHVQARIAELGR